MATAGALAPVFATSLATVITSVGASAATASVVASAVAPIVAGAVAGAAIGTVTSVANAALQCAETSSCPNFGKAAIGGVVAGAVTGAAGGVIKVGGVVKGIEHIAAPTASISKALPKVIQTVGENAVDAGKALSGKLASQAGLILPIPLPVSNIVPSR